MASAAARVWPASVATAAVAARNDRAGQEDEVVLTESETVSDIRQLKQQQRLSPRIVWL